MSSSTASAGGVEGMLSKGGQINGCNTTTRDKKYTADSYASALAKRAQAQRSESTAGGKATTLSKTRTSATTHPANPLRVRGRKCKKDQEKEQGELCEHGNRRKSGETMRKRQQAEGENERGVRERGRRRAKQAPHRLLAAFSSTLRTNMQVGLCGSIHSQARCRLQTTLTGARESGALDLPLTGVGRSARGAPARVNDRRSLRDPAYS